MYKYTQWKLSNVIAKVFAPQHWSRGNIPDCIFDYNTTLNISWKQSRLIYSHTELKLTNTYE